MSARVWLLRTPSHVWLVLSSKQPDVPRGSNCSVSDITEAVREFADRNPEWMSGHEQTGQ